MKIRIPNLFLALAILTVTSPLLAADDAKAEKENWQVLFDGKTLDGWEKVGKEDSYWKVEEGAIVGTGNPSMLVCTQGPFKNFRYRVEAKINDGGNSGVYFRTTRKPGFTDGYEAQV
ncbi:MAG: DUF1080 domain-containing protein, partial [Planctomycetaceae bacterium]|nr:DUF1080 domain-containing protein [Planctomycetaceae bacterium]